MNLQKLLQYLRRRQRPASPEPGEVLPHDTPSPTPAPAERKLDRLEIQEVIILHLEWCVLFNEHLGADNTLQAPDRPLPGAKGSELGQWIERMRSQPPGERARFAELEREHLHFHQLADQALALARSGHMHLASTLLNTDFERSRARLLDLLRSMRSR
jgi:hypothetical protein